MPRNNPWERKNTRPSGTGRDRTSVPNEPQPRRQQQPLEFNEAHFPTLPSQRQAIQSRVGGANEWEATIDPKMQSAQNQVSDLFDAVNELNKHLNIAELIRFVKDLTQVAKTCTNPIEKSMNAVHFIQTNAIHYKI